MAAGHHRRSPVIDGGIRSSDNADLAAGFERVLVLSPLGMVSAAQWPWPGLADQVRDLTEQGATVEVITPDDAALAAFGTNPLDPTTRGPAAKAGLAQGRAAAAAVADWR